LAYRITHRTTEFIQLLSVHPPIERSTDISTFQPELDVVQFVGHRILTTSEHGPSDCRRRKRTLIIVRRILTEPKTALAGVTLAASFARFRASMATFNEEMVPSRPFGC